MQTDRYHRKKFLSSFGYAAAATAFSSVIPTGVQAQYKLAHVDLPDDEYLFGKGITYLNTGTLGPCRRDTMETAYAKWKDLELLPVKFYGKFGAELLAEKTRETASAFLGCDFKEILITTSTTNGMNAIAQGLRLQPGDRILTTDQEHGGGLLCWNYFAKYYNVVIDKISIPPGENDASSIIQRFREKLDRKTRLISVSHVFSSTGLRAPVPEISALARENGILCIVDGAQAVGAINVNVKDLGCHAYATSGHKWLMGPKGTGLLYIAKDAQDIIRPMQFEESYNTYTDGNGVVNLANILGLGKAIEYIQTVGIKKIEQHNLSLRDRLYTSLSNIGDTRILSPREAHLSSSMLTLLLPPRIDKTAFVKTLFEKYRISIRPTHKEFGFNGIRFSTHIFNTEKEIDFASDMVRKELS